MNKRYKHVFARAASLAKEANFLMGPDFSTEQLEKLSEKVLSKRQLCL